jgi:hypothetical protein
MYLRVVIMLDVFLFLTWVLDGSDQFRATAAFPLD